eukprot:scaffold168026_cov34-Prasinocladus_malaysianus.AAC.2
MAACPCGKPGWPTPPHGPQQPNFVSNSSTMSSTKARLAVERRSFPTHEGRNITAFFPLVGSTTKPPTKKSNKSGRGTRSKF